MKFHDNGLRDKRTRIYLPVTRTLLNKGVEKSELLVGNTLSQPVINYMPEMAELPPGSSIVVDFGYAIHGGIMIVSHEGKKIRLQFGESVSETLGASNQDHSRMDAELELPRFGMLEYGNTVFRFARIENIGDEAFSCQNITAVALEHDLEVTGSFESSDERLNNIWKTSIRTVHLCMQDYIYDGAKRDRIVWMGDMHPEVRGITCAFSDVSIVRDSFEFLVAQASPEKPMNNINTYSCWFIVTLLDYYLATGDLAFLNKHKAYIAAVLATFCRYVGDDGVECVPERRFLDWPNNDILDAKHAGIQALMLWMMQAGEKLLRTLGLDCHEVVAAQHKLKKHIPDCAGQKAPAALMTLTGLADRRDVLENNPFHGVSTFYGFYVLLAKETVPALELIRNYWGAMLDYGATSFWEDFDLDWIKNASRIDEPPVPGKDDLHADFGNYCYTGLRHSLSHGWSCGPAPFLSERVLGVRFLEPGGRKISIQPDLGDLEYVTGTVPTPYGVISVTAETGGKIKCDTPPEVEIVK